MIELFFSEIKGGGGVKGGVGISREKWSFEQIAFTFKPCQVVQH